MRILRMGFFTLFLLVLVYCQYLYINVNKNIITKVYSSIGYIKPMKI